MNDTHQHLDDDAALYALGMLDDDARARIDASARGCATCAARLGDAEAAVAAMAEASLARPHSGHPRFAAWAGLAAALVFAVTSAVLGAQNAALRGEMAGDGAVLGTLVRSHFLHAQFVAPDGAPAPAKVLYERTGSWYEIVALGATPAWRIVAVRDSGARDVPERFAVRGDTAVLLARGLGPVRAFRLVDAAGRTIAVVRPVASEDDAARR